MLLPPAVADHDEAAAAAAADIDVDDGEEMVTIVMVVVVVVVMSTDGGNVQDAVGNVRRPTMAAMAMTSSGFSDLP